MLPGLDILGGSGAGLSGSSSATAQGGTVGDFNFSPKAGVHPLLIAGVVIVAALLFWRR